ncbi:hypothetical protein Nepgr_029656 [Nepenthes gracilis]|uniref:Uncharacterized protein n=1 Tax=Nepenthes gracilis TaxID=150966 RepID=A0AAD3TCV2_NEPGR|nr:hypothetical protein Nepgr_029656 [Nepenthes gracilis]
MPFPHCVSFSEQHSGQSDPAALGGGAVTVGSPLAGQLFTWPKHSLLVAEVALHLAEALVFLHHTVRGGWLRSETSSSTIPPESQGIRGRATTESNQVPLRPSVGSLLLLVHHSRSPRLNSSQPLVEETPSDE